jgi:hypothetical protein
MKFCWTVFILIVPLVWGLNTDAHVNDFYCNLMLNDEKLVSFYVKQEVEIEHLLQTNNHIDEQVKNS